MSMETIETAVTDRLAEYYAEQSRFAVALNFYGESHTGARLKPCCVFSAGNSEILHPQLTKLTVEMELMAQIDDTKPRRASRAAREIEAHVLGAVLDLCRHLNQAGVGIVRKYRRVSPRLEIEGERTRVWATSWELWIQELRAF